MDRNVVMSWNIDAAAAAACFVRLDQLASEPDHTPMKLQKLLYIAQANYLASTSHPLFAERMEAFEHGPVVYDVWREYPGREIIKPEDHPAVSSLDVPEDLEDFLGRVWEKYGSKSASWLRRYTHGQAPWRDSFDPMVYRCVIPNESMRTFYQQKVSAAERVFPDSVVSVPFELLEQDSESESRLAAFLRG